MTSNVCSPLSPRLKVIRINAERALGQRRVPPFALGQIFGQQAGQKVVRFGGVDEGVDELVNPHFAQRYSLDWHVVPRKRLDGKEILA